MEELQEYITKLIDGLKILSEDVSRIKANKVSEAKEKEGQQGSKKMSMKSMQRITKLYKGEEEIREAQENPDVDFINKQIEDIFSK